MDRDVRQGSEWSIPQRIKNDAIFLAARGALGAARWFSPATLRGVGVLMSRLLMFSKLRTIARKNVRRVYRDFDDAATSAFVKRCFRELGACAGHTVAGLFSPLDPYPMDSDSRQTIKDALAEGRGVVLPSAHLGEWERVAATLVSNGVPLTALVRESYDPRFDALLAPIRGRACVEAIPRGHPAAATRIVRALRRNRVLAAPMDLRSRVPSVTVPFLGIPAQTAVGPARIALRTRAPVVVATLERLRSGLAVTATRLDDSGDEVALTARINEELGRRIATAPELWVWMHERWG